MGWWSQAQDSVLPTTAAGHPGSFQAVSKLPSPGDSLRKPIVRLQRKTHTNRWSGHLVLLGGHMTDSRKDKCHSRGRVGTRHRRTLSSRSSQGWHLQVALP